MTVSLFDNIHIDDEHPAAVGQTELAVESTVIYLPDVKTITMIRPTEAVELTVVDRIL